MAQPLPNCISAPSWWQLIQWVADPLRFQDKYSQTYGDCFTMRLGSLGEFVLLGNPQAIQDVFSQDAKFDGGRGNSIAESLVGRNSLMLMDGDRHRRERKLLMPPFHGERLHTYAQQIVDITRQVTDRWQVGQPFVARTAMQQISLEIILQIVFGLREGDRYDQLKPLLTAWLDMTDSPLRSSLLFFKVLQQDLGPWSPWGRMKLRQRQVHALLKAEIGDRRAPEQAPGQAPGQAPEQAPEQAPGTDVLSLMMAARDEAGQPMADEELRDELLTILFAGHETTSTTLAWALYEIHRRPQVYETLIAELDSLGDEASPMAVAQLPYLNAVCQETLRMYPVLPVIFPGIAKEPVQVAGQWFDAETIFMPTIYLVHYREDLYANAHEFQPERFLNRQYSPSEYFPFGGGSRRCLGYALAQLEMKLVLATGLSQCRLALSDERPVKLQRRGFTLAPSGGVPLVMTHRRAAQPSPSPMH